ncbi:MAG TPA: RICIN domain-containing protein [Candidatus Saccharimonadales bacterium]|nr:RICIN domain-containing protein [Candidatus Saccharimonadales bacterium]
MVQKAKKTVKKSKAKSGKKQSWLPGQPSPSAKRRNILAALFVGAVIVIGSIVLAVSHAASSQPEGQIKLANNALCLNNQKGEQEKGNPVQLQTCGHGSQQQWKLSGKHIMLDSDEGKLCFAVRRAGTGNTAEVHGHIWTCDGGNPQQWTPHNDGSLVNTPTGLCLQAESATSGAGVVLATCNNSALQHWTMPVKTTPPPSHTVTPEMKKIFTKYAKDHYPTWKVTSMQYDPQCDGSESYDVALTNAKKEHLSIILDRNGTYIQKEVDVPFSKAPAILTSTLKAHYSMYTYGGTYEQITMANSDLRYLVDLASGKKSSELILSQTGIKLCQTAFE